MLLPTPIGIESNSILYKFFCVLLPGKSLETPLVPLLSLPQPTRLEPANIIASEAVNEPPSILRRVIVADLSTSSNICPST